MNPALDEIPARSLRRRISSILAAPLGANVRRALWGSTSEGLQLMWDGTIDASIMLWLPHRSCPKNRSTVEVVVLVALATW